MDPASPAPAPLTPSVNLLPADLLALVLAQLRDIIAAVEHHGVEIGMLVAVLLDLIERHEAAAGRSAASVRADDPPDAAGRLGELLNQLAADHRTMLSFNGPLLLLQQFYDRLRQRLEHVNQALLLLPHASGLSAETLAQATALFPLNEERIAASAASGVAVEPEEVPAIELF